MKSLKKTKQVNGQDRAVGHPQGRKGQGPTVLFSEVPPDADESRAAPAAVGPARLLPKVVTPADRNFLPPSDPLSRVGAWLRERFASGDPQVARCPFCRTIFVKRRDDQAWCSATCRTRFPQVERAVLLPGAMEKCPCDRCGRVVAARQLTLAILAGGELAQDRAAVCRTCSYEDQLTLTPEVEGRIRVRLATLGVPPRLAIPVLTATGAWVVKDEDGKDEVLA